MLDLENAILKLEQIRLMVKLITQTSLTKEEQETATDILQQITENVVNEIMSTFYHTSKA